LYTWGEEGGRSSARMRFSSREPAICSANSQFHHDRPRSSAKTRDSSRETRFVQLNHSFITIDHGLQLKRVFITGIVICSAKSQFHHDRPRSSAQTRFHHGNQPLD